jgi:hypothetical protein
VPPQTGDAGLLRASQLLRVAPARGDLLRRLHRPASRAIPALIAPGR